MRHAILAALLSPLVAASAGVSQSREGGRALQVEVTDLGPMGTGTNMFRCGLVHSSGLVFIGTYGPAPAVIFRYDPQTHELTQVAAPGEYQLDCMVEAPNGMIYIGTAYNGLVYELDPITGEVSSLGSPPIDSTSWIFTMICTSRGEILGAKGVGLFRLDWRERRLEAVGIVPGNHETPGPNSSAPIIRQLEEDQEGLIWGDTNRWLFRFDPETRQIELLADMVEVDPACYALFNPRSFRPTRDHYFGLYSRFSGRKVRTPLYAYRAGSSALEALSIAGLNERIVGLPEWWRSGDDLFLLAPAWDEDELRSCILVIDVEQQQIVDRLKIEGGEAGGLFLPGPGPGTQSEMYYHTFKRLLRLDHENHRLVAVGENPIPVECRCLAVSPLRVLGTDTYDLGYAFTMSLRTQESKDHGKVWVDDHRCNYGPAAFAGVDGRYFLANHGEAMPSLFVTDTHTNRHWRIGDPATQLVPLSDGTVVGTAGANPPAIAFTSSVCWTAAWQSRPGAVFRYRPGEEQVEPLEALGSAGPVTEAPYLPGGVLVACGEELCVYDPARTAVIERVPLPQRTAAATADLSRAVAYIVLSDSSLHACRRDGEGLVLSRLADGFGPVERGFFVLRQSGRVVGIAEDGTVAFYDPERNAWARLQGPPPPPAGPAVDPTEDAWYYADRSVLRYSLGA